MDDYKVLYRKYRPKNFNEIIGQDNIKEVLINSIKLNKIAHSYIFTGPRGTGKTSTAKIFAKTLNCLDNSNGISCDNCEMCENYNISPDIIEIDAASNNGVDEIRSLRDSVKVAPYSSKYKIYIIDEVHMLSNSAWNAFLKTLEEPPSHVIFILATTEINKIPDTVKSRCQRFDFSKISHNIMCDYLLKICKKEKISVDSKSINLISKLSNGCLRDALSFLDKLSKLDTTITEKIIEENFGILNDDLLDIIYDSINTSNVKKINENIDKIANSGVTPLNFINEFINYLIKKIINQQLTDYDEINTIKNIINRLNMLVSSFNSVINPFILIKVELITINYFPGNNLKIEEEKKQVAKEDNVNIEQEQNELIEENNFDVENIKSIRINNSFVEASKELKSFFSSNWNSLLKKINKSNDYNIYGIVENANIEVVSKKNVIFSLEQLSESVIFNDNLEKIEKYYNEEYKVDYSFISLSKEEWIEEKKKFIKNKDKKYEYIDEKKIIKSNKSKASNIAEDLFGDNIIEIR